MDVAFSSWLARSPCLAIAAHYSRRTDGPRQLHRTMTECEQQAEKRELVVGKRRGFVAAVIPKFGSEWIFRSAAIHCPHCAWTRVSVRRPSGVGENRKKVRTEEKRTLAVECDRLAWHSKSAVGRCSSPPSVKTLTIVGENHPRGKHKQREASGFSRCDCYHR